MTRRSSKRTGFSLIELLVVLGIIATLTGLLLPAVQHVRQTAARTTCQNKLRQIALAAHQYHGAYSAFPPGVSYEGGKSPTRSLSWNARLLPYLEQEATWREIEQAFQQDQNFLHNPPHVWLFRPMPAYLCPSDGLAPGRRHGATNYFGVEGLNLRTMDGVFWMDSRIRFVDIRDGTSHTLLVGERPTAASGVMGWWYAGEGQNKEGSGDMVLGVRELNVSSYGGGCPDGPYKFVRGDQKTNCSFFHFWSLHSGGANFAFADGSVRFLSYAADAVLPALATRAGGEVVALD